MDNKGGELLFHFDWGVSCAGEPCDWGEVEGVQP